MSRRLSESKKEGQLKSSGRVPLKDVVADCERRWFEDALKAAKSGEVDMQSLVGQMFCSGYGVAVDVKQDRESFGCENQRAQMKTLLTPEEIYQSAKLWTFLAWIPKHLQLAYKVSSL